MKKNYPLIVMLCLSWVIVSGQTTFDKVYNLTNGDVHSIIGTLDGKYMLSGTEVSSTNKWCLTKIDSFGNIISKWKYDFGVGAAYECRVQQCLDSGYIAYGQGEGVAALIKVDKNGAFLWKKNLPNSSGNIKSCLVTDIGQILVSCNGSGDGFGVVKLSSSGNVIWSRRNITGFSCFTQQILQMSDGNYLLSGAAQSGSSTYNPTIIKIDTSGNIIWTKKIVDFQMTNVFEICETTDGGIAAIGWGNCSSTLIKLDANLNYVWSVYSPAYGCSSFALDMVALSGNRIGILAYNGSPATHFFEVNPTGTSVIDKKITNSLYYPGSYGSIVQNRNASLPAGAVMCAFVSNNGGGNRYEIVRMKSDFTGCSVSTPTTSPTGTYAVSVAGGIGLSNTTPVMTNTGVPVVTNPSSSLITYCNLSPLSISASGTNPLCNGTCNGSATVTPSGGQSPFTYTWLPSGGNSATASGLCANTYTVLVKDASNSTVTAVINIIQPGSITAISSQSNISCNGGNNGVATISASGGTGSLTYSWSPSGGTSSTASGLTAGTYTCTIKDANNCIKTQAVTLSQPAVLSLNTSGITNITCNSLCNGSVTLTASGGTAGYTIIPPATTGLCANNYTYTVTDANSCVATTTFTIIQPAALTATASTTLSAICNGNSTTLSGSVSGGTGSITYNWSPGGPGASINVSPSSNTTYSLTATDANSCTANSMVTITVNPLPSLSISTNNSLICGPPYQGTATINASGASTYTWNTSVTTNSISVSPSVTTQYTVTGTDSNGCENTAVITQSVSACTGIGESGAAGSGFVIFPNPTSGQVIVVAPPLKTPVLIYNSIGELIYKTEITKEKTEIDLDKEISGIYFIRIGKTVQKLVKN